MNYETVTALNIVNPDVILIGGEWRTVGAAHYSGPIDGSGMVTLELIGRDQWTGHATDPIRRVAPIAPFHILAGDLRPDRDQLIHDGIPSLVTDVEWPATGNPYSIRVTLADGRTVATYSDRTVAIV